MSRYPEPLASKIYSGNQIAILTVFFGPAAAVYFLKKNFDAMGATDKAKKTQIYGIISILVLFLALPFAPEIIPPISYVIGYVAAAFSTFNTYQKPALESAERHSTWKATGVAALWFVATTPIYVLIIYIYELQGWISI